MASDLTEDQKLVMLGLRSPNQQATAQTTTITVFKNNIASEWDTFQENFEDAGLTTWSGFKTWLTNNGVPASTSSSIRTQLESKYPTFSDYAAIIANPTSWEDYSANFKVGSGLRSSLKTDDGLSAAGIQVYEEAGVGRAGQQIPSGGVEVYGRQVHFSQSDATQEPAEDQSANPITYSNLTVSDQSPVITTPVDVSADVTNNTNVPGIGVVVELIVDGSVTKRKSIEVPALSTETTTFTTSFDTYDSFDVSIGDTSPVTVTVVHQGL